MLSSEPRICVVGSSNIDLLVKVPRLPKMGETLLGHSFQVGFGGKGANQAVMAARLGAHVAMVTKLGRDPYGESTIENYRTHGIDVTYVIFDDTTHSGVAPILVDDRGDNMIVVVAGANTHLSPLDAIEARDVIMSATVLICQLETPIETTLAAFQVARDHGVKTILNPAPAQPLPRTLLSLTDILVPNEIEAKILVGGAWEGPLAVRRAYDHLTTNGFEGVLVLTLGSQGSIVIDKTSDVPIPPFSVEVLDTTGAGDAFVGALAYFVAIDEEIVLAASRASVVAGLSVAKIGTQVSFPSRGEANAAFMKAGLGGFLPELRRRLRET